MKKIDISLCKPAIGLVNYIVHFVHFSVVSSPSTSSITTSRVLVLAALIMVVILATASIVLRRSLILVILLVLICLMMRSLIILPSLREILMSTSLALKASSVLVSRLINQVLLVVLAKGLNRILSISQVSLRYDVWWILLVIHCLLHILSACLRLGASASNIEVYWLHIRSSTSVRWTIPVIHSFLWIIILALVPVVSVVLLMWAFLTNQRLRCSLKASRCLILRMIISVAPVVLASSVSSPTEVINRVLRSVYS